jgi:hypothetical protein
VTGTADVEAGICGHRTMIVAETADGRAATFTIETTCENITRFVDLVNENGPFDAFAEIDPRRESRLLSLGHEARACTDCVVPAAALKALRVATGLALPADVRIAITKE